MASCDDSGFSLLVDDHQSNSDQPHHHILHQSYGPPHRQIHAPPPLPPILPPSAATDGTANLGSSEGDEQEPEEGVDDENDTVSALPVSNPFTDSSNPYNNSNNYQTVQTTTEKRRDQEDCIVNNGNSNHSPYSFKRAKPSINEFRKDREEWSDLAIGCFLEIYMEKFNQLNRGNLRGRDWEEVAAMVSERCEKQSKTVEQCKNKLDNLKKRYNLEKHRMINGGVSASHWSWFKKVEEIIENSLSMKAATSICVANDEDKGGEGNGGASESAVKQSKR